MKPNDKFGDTDFRYIKVVKKGKAPPPPKFPDPKKKP